MKNQSPPGVPPTLSPSSERSATIARGKDFRELADLLPMTVFELDCQGRFTFVNQFGLEFSGYTAADLELGVSIAQITQAPPGISLQDNFRRRLTGAPDTHTNYSFVTRDGQLKPITVHTNPIIEEGRVVGLRGVVVDLSEQKRLEEATARAERLEAAGRIAGQVAHDFNNLLSPVLAYSQLIREKLEPNHPAAAYLDDIEMATRQLSEISQQLLTLARRGHYKLLPLDMNEVVRGVVDFARNAPPGLQVTLRLEPGLRAVLGGPAQLSRVMLNLVENARDAMQDLGELTIETRVVETMDRLGVLGRIPAGTYVSVTVADTGPGIAPSLLMRIFEPFFTTKQTDRRRGSGLGLSTVYAVLQDHNGYLDVETQLGKGTKFTVLLPASDLPPASRPKAPLQSGSEQILVVDDDPMQRQVSRDVLEHLGYRVHVALSGEQALALVKDGFLPDLVVLDMSLGAGMDGAETYQSLRETVPNLRAIVLSAYAEGARVDAAMALGAGQFLRKPVDIATIARAVRQELDRGS